MWHVASRNYIVSPQTHFTLFFLQIVVFLDQWPLHVIYTGGYISLQHRDSLYICYCGKITLKKMCAELVIKLRVYLRCRKGNDTV